MVERPLWNKQGGLWFETMTPPGFCGCFSVSCMVSSTACVWTVDVTHFGCKYFLHCFKRPKHHFKHLADQYSGSGIERPLGSWNVPSSIPGSPSVTVKCPWARLLSHYLLPVSRLVPCMGSSAIVLWICMWIGKCTVMHDHYILWQTALIHNVTIIPVKHQRCISLELPLITLGGSVTATCSIAHIDSLDQNNNNNNMHLYSAFHKTKALYEIIHRKTKNYMP